MPMVIAGILESRAVEQKRKLVKDIEVKLVGSNIGILPR